MHFIGLIVALLIASEPIYSQNLKIANVNIAWTKRGPTQIDFSVVAELPSSLSSSNAYVAIGFNSAMNMVSSIIFHSFLPCLNAIFYKKFYLKSSEPALSHASTSTVANSLAPTTTRTRPTHPLS